MAAKPKMPVNPYRVFANRFERVIREVVKKWERGDMAGAVNEARLLADEYEAYRKHQAHIESVTSSHGE